MLLHSFVTMEAELKRIYYGDSTGAFRGPDALYSQAVSEGVVGVTLGKVKRWLSSEPVYTLYRPARRNYPRRRVTAKYAGHIVQVDIMDMQRLRQTFRYVLLAYDTFSKYLTGVPLKNRTPDAVQEALDIIITRAPYPIHNIYWDKEGAFISKQIQAYLKTKDIHNYTTKSKVKAPGVERAIRTMRLWLQRFLDSNKTVKWVPRLPILIKQYNNRATLYHQAPTSRAGDQPNADTQTASLSQLPEGKPKLPPIGSYVRLNRLRQIFDKEATGTFTSEVFRVRGHRKKGGIPLIYVSDLQGEEILGGLYPQEYQAILWDGDKPVERILKRRHRKGEPKQFFVKYRGYPDKFNEWISFKPVV